MNTIKCIKWGQSPAFPSVCREEPWTCVQCQSKDSTPPQPPSETPTELDVAIVTLRDASRRIVQARNIRALDAEENISIEAAHLDLTCNAAERARQLEKELQEAKSSWGSQQALLKCGDEKIAQLTTELNEAKSSFQKAADFIGLQKQSNIDYASELEKLTTELALLKLRCGEMREALEANGVFHTPLALRKNGKPWDEYQIDAINRTKLCLSSPHQPSPSIPMDVAEKMYEALERNKQWLEADSEEGCDCGMNEHCSYCSKGISTLNKTDKALSLAEKHGLGKKQ